MKKTITILLVLIGFGLSAQITILPKLKKTLVKSEWIAIDTITAFNGNNVVNDSVMYTFNKVPDELFKRVETSYREVGDTMIHLTKITKLELYRSRNAILYQLKKSYVMKEVPNSNDDIVKKIIIKAKQMGIQNNDVVWNYPLMDSIINPPVVINDTIQ